MNVTLKPIGTMKSLFHFKNGTPRQASVCPSTPGILTIQKSIFNNPEHSLEGLEEYSHAWVIFAFHKNNNIHTKAKVKPPRLDGKRIGVFSTRSPYRPNNIGLSLLKIDKVEGPTIYFSGVDMIDGTPVLDVKPYIPEYDCPMSNISQPPVDMMQSQSAIEDSGVVSMKTLECSDMDNTAEAAVADTAELENGFYAVSAALDKAGQKLNSRKPEEETSGTNFPLQEISSSVKSPEGFPCAREGPDEDLDSFLGGIISQAALTVSSELSGTHNSAVCGSDSDTGGVSVAESSYDVSVIDSNSSSLDQVQWNVYNVSLDPSAAEWDGRTIECDKTCVKNQICNVSPGAKHETETFGLLQKDLKTHFEKLCVSKEVNEDRKSNTKNFPVVAPWLNNPPVPKLNVTFTTEALQQLNLFSKSSSDSQFCLQLLSGPREAESAIRSVLREEPRSVYRRQHCHDSLYFFTVDVVHVTCWFDEDTAQVLRLKPVASVARLRDRLENLTQNSHA